MEQKHHYIPQFYLKQWTGPDHQLCEFSRPYRGVIVKRKHTSATGYVRGLYSIPIAPPHVRDVFENRFMSVADDVAARSLQVMINDRYVPTGPQKIAWTRFMMSLLYRTPEGVTRSFEMIRKYYQGKVLDDLRPVYASLKRPEDPATPEEYMQINAAGMTWRSHIEHLMDIIESARVRDRIIAMQWHLGWMENLKHPLLTGDRPIIMTNGIAKADSHMVMPLSPKHVFIAANADEEVAKIKALAKTGELAYRMNDRIVRQARKFVYASDTRQLRFVEKRLGEKAVCSPFE